MLTLLVLTLQCHGESDTRGAVHSPASEQVLLILILVSLMLSQLLCACRSVEERARTNPGRWRRMVAWHDACGAIDGSPDHALYNRIVAVWRCLGDRAEKELADLDG